MSPSAVCLAVSVQGLQSAFLVLFVFGMVRWSPHNSVSVNSCYNDKQKAVRFPLFFLERFSLILFTVTGRERKRERKRRKRKEL